jgi:hypothetical protein
MIFNVFRISILQSRGWHLQLNAATFHGNKTNSSFQLPTYEPPYRYLDMRIICESLIDATATHLVLFEVSKASVFESVGMPNLCKLPRNLQDPTIQL